MPKLFSRLLLHEIFKMLEQVLANQAEIVELLKHPPNSLSREDRAVLEKAVKRLESLAKEH